MDNWKRFSYRIANIVVPFKKRILIILLFTLFAAGLGVIEPLVYKYFIDELMVDNNNAYKIIVITVVALFLLSVGRELTNGIQNWLVWKVRLKLQVDLQATAVEKLYSLPLSYHQKEGVGSTMTKFDRAINGFVAAFCDIAFLILPALIYLIVSVFVMFRLDWKLTLVVLFFAPLPAIIGMWASKEQTARERFLMESWAKIYGRFNEAFSSILTVKSFAMERAEINSFLSKVVNTNHHVVRGIGTDSKVGALKSITITLARIAALSFGGYLISAGEMTLGTLLAFLGYLGSLFGPVQGLTTIYQTFRKASVSLEILNSILEADDPVADVTSASEVQQLSGEVTFENISFGYSHNNPVLSNFNLHVQAGETVAIVGPSGVGKSTLMSLILRLINPSSGVLKLDGHDIRLLKQCSIRQHIGVVLQDSLLFNDSISSNIAYGSLHATQNEIELAAKLANAHEFIMQLPQQYETVVGERGNSLSGGQKQRIAIARAILKDPAILILDEATSALDSEADILVQEAFRRLIKGRTTFVISHKMSNIVDADKIVVLKNGRISKIITPNEISRGEDIYAY